VSKLTENTANYNTAAKLRIYGGNDACDRAEMLAESNLIVHTRWIEYNFKFEPQADYSHILFEAFFNTPTLFPYNGNLLLDAASNLKLVPCNETEVIAEEVAEAQETIATQPAVQPSPEIVQETPTPPVPTPPTPQIQAEAPPVAQALVIESSSFADINQQELRTGTIIRTNQIYFEADKSTINERSFETLQQLYQFLNNNLNMRIEIGGHTNGLPPEAYCDQLSTARAKAVVEYLQRQGISADRLEFKGYGKRQRIASDDTLEGRRKNQRVEIKILDLGRD
jgi:outer membrane protein OmpA-like peptidoglycan-associated protein